MYRLFYFFSPRNRDWKPIVHRNGRYFLNGRCRRNGSWWGVLSFVCVSSVPESLGRRPDASSPPPHPPPTPPRVTFACTRSPGARAPNAGCRRRYELNSKCRFSFQPSPVTEDVQTINRIDFLKSYCLCSLPECHFLSFQTTVSLPSRHPPPRLTLPFSLLSSLFCIKQNWVSSAENVSSLTLNRD